MFNKILLATDDSVPAKKAIDYVQNIAIKYNAEVILLNTYYIPDMFNGKPSEHYMYLSKVEENMKEHGEKILYETSEKMKAKNINVNTLLIKGPTGPTIVSEAEKNNCDLIVMGSRGLGNVTSILISSASNYTIHHAKCPVLLIK
ncbi:MAG: universal stress protein [Candidatus Sericytochromatia bacterium]|nr:universal stress protein [Candidatus Sericytochromatia bacterium]